MIPRSRPTVVVGVTTKNRASILSRALESALAQDFQPLRLAVLDDGSTDATYALRTRFPSVEWQRNDASQGIIESRNRLMRTANADYFVSLDDDAWFLDSDEISIAVARMESEPRVGAIAFDILSPDRPNRATRSQPTPSAMFIGCGHLIRLSAAKEVGFYAPTPGTYGSEEKDLSLRLADRGYRVEFLPGVHVWHDKAWHGRDWYPLHRSGVCNELVMTLRRCPFPDVVAVLPLKLASYAWFWLRKPRYCRAGVAGVAQFLRNFGFALRTRSPVARLTFWRSARGGWKS